MPQPLSEFHSVATWSHELLVSTIGAELLWTPGGAVFVHAHESGAPVGDVVETKLSTLPPEAAWIKVVAVVNGDDELAVTVRGEADIVTAGRLRAELMAVLPVRATRVLVDVADLSFCDLAGIDALREFVSAASAGGARVELRGMSRLMSWMYETFVPGKARRYPREPAD